MLQNLPSRRAITALRKVGFEVKRSQKHITVVNETTNKQLTIPHGMVKKGLLYRIIKQAGLTVEEFKRLL